MHCSQTNFFFQKLNSTNLVKCVLRSKYNRPNPGWTYNSSQTGQISFLLKYCRYLAWTHKLRFKCVSWPNLAMCQVLEKADFSEKRSKGHTCSDIYRNDVARIPDREKGREGQLLCLPCPPGTGRNHILDLTGLLPLHFPFVLQSAWGLSPSFSNFMETTATHTHTHKQWGKLFLLKNKC